MPDHQWRHIVVQDVVIPIHPSKTDEPDHIKAVVKPGGQNEEVYGCKVCGEEMTSAIENNLPCAGEAVEDLIARWGEDLGALLTMEE